MESVCQYKNWHTKKWQHVTISPTFVLDAYLYVSRIPFGISIKFMLIKVNLMHMHFMIHHRISCCIRTIVIEEGVRVNVLLNVTIKYFGEISQKWNHLLCKAQRVSSSPLAESLWPFAHHSCLCSWDGESRIPAWHASASKMARYTNQM